MDYVIKCPFCLDAKAVVADTHPNHTKVKAVPCLNCRERHRIEGVILLRTRALELLIMKDEVEK